MTCLKWLILTVFLGISAEPLFIGIHGSSNKLQNETLTEEFDCMDRPYGYYAVAQCSPHFVNCIQDSKYIMTCHNNSVYNAVTGHCDSLDNCLKQANDSNTTAVIPSKSTCHERIVNKNDFDCTEKRDGAYALEKCGNKYVMCMNERRSEIFHCPDGLVFDSGAEQCSSIELCIKCDNLLQATDHIDALEKSLAVRCYGATRFHYERICKNKASGYYTSGCKNYYYFCIDRYGYSPRKFLCPSGLFFDAKKIRCARKETISECSTITSPHPPNYLPSVHADDDYCKDKETGFYGVDCNSFWYSCSMGITYKFTCPEGMFYDMENSHCSWKEDVAACRATTLTTDADNTVLENSLATRNASTTDDNYCKNKSNGFHVEGCNSTFYSCHNGFGSKFSCLEENLFFDDEKIACVQRNTVRNCEHYGSSSIDSVPSIIADDYCREKEDGFYGEDCSSFFFSCSSGHMYKFDCPWSMNYNQKKRHCERKEDIAACNSTTTPVASRDSLLQNSVITTDAPSDPEYSCKGKKNGFHGNHCSTVFYMCKNETAYKIHCSPGTIYNVDEQSCEFEVTACLKGNDLEIAISADPDSKKKGYTRKPSFELLCDQVKDGYFAHGCKDHVIRCVNGTANEIKCYRGFYYDSQRYRCDHRQNIEECKPRTNGTPKYNLNDEETTAAATDIDGKLQSFSCQGADDGQYPLTMDCSQSFQVCVANVSYPMKCPDGLVFNRYTKLCDEYSCAEIPPETTEMLKEQGKSCANRWPVVYYSWSKLDAVFCSKKKDGLYNLMECDRLYSSCVNRTFTYNNCDYSEAFNAETNKCDAKENVKACQKNYKADLMPVDPMDACAYKEDGHYPTAGCSQYFMICYSNVRYDQYCPADLVYNAEKKHCDKKENVKTCEGVPVKVAPTKTEPKRTGCNSVEKPPSHQTYLAKWHQIRKIFCYQMEDGDYTLWDCSSYYIRCVDNTFNMLQCPDELVFNPETNKCDDEDSVAMCTPHLGAGYF